MSSHTEFSTPEEKRMLHFLPGAAGQQGTGDSALLLERFILLSLKKKVRCTVLPSSKFNSENCPRESNWRLFITPIMHSSELEVSPTPPSYPLFSRESLSVCFCLETESHVVPAEDDFQLLIVHLCFTRAMIAGVCPHAKQAPLQMTSFSSPEILCPGSSFNHS